MMTKIYVLCLQMFLLACFSNPIENDEIYQILRNNDLSIFYNNHIKLTSQQAFKHSFYYLKEDTFHLKKSESQFYSDFKNYSDSMVYWGFDGFDSTFTLFGVNKNGRYQKNYDKEPLSDFIVTDKSLQLIVQLVSCGVVEIIGLPWLGEMVVFKLRNGDQFIYCRDLSKIYDNYWRGIIQNNLNNDNTNDNIFFIPR